MACTLVYTISTGRSGTAFLAEFLRANLPGATVHHERTNFTQMGKITPEASQFMLFNNVGNVPELQAFWKRRLAADAADEADIFVETSHFNARGGMLENLDQRPDDTRVVVVAQSRDMLPTVWSLHNRCDFRNNGFTWLFALDPRWRNVIVRSKEFGRWGMAGSAMWYVIEMQTRAAYYKRLLSDAPGVDFVEVDLSELREGSGGGERVLKAVLGEDPASVSWPDAQNEARDQLFPDKDRETIAAIIERLNFDAEKLAGDYWDSGRRLASPPWVTLRPKGDQTDGKAALFQSGRGDPESP